MSTPDLFPDTLPEPPPRAKPRVMMHVCDAGDGVAQYECRRCGAVSEWPPFTTISEVKRGIPCPDCNTPTP